ncbi:hypothetical protein [Actinomadura sp. WMMB 499]|uniref:hypothetical protein n=1 Tax=Actinomadura sp. WMMB 499 TaxID=1219491 RepID=UPI001243B258|nr:hypothetical protein [Actinomadura sp. WMMB 499]QFG25291.1 hypothetical protein F7P10_33230 [Actinomadura sp. WMMB 499]
MHRIGGIAVVSAAALALTLGPATGAGGAVTALPAAQPATAPAAAPAAKTQARNFVFTKRKPSFSYRDRVGRFHAQVDLRGSHSKRYPMPWAFVITNKKLKAIARGKATCVARGLNGRYHDRHVIPVGYTWHSTVRPHRAKKVYELTGHCRFRVQVGGRPGVAHVGFEFRYAIDPTRRYAPKSTGPVVKTSVDIRH